jgi:hypothetical protein
MAIAVVLEFDGATLDQYDHPHRRVGPSRRCPVLDGVLSNHARVADDLEGCAYELGLLRTTHLSGDPRRTSHRARIGAL